MRITRLVGSAACAGLLSVAPAAAMPGSGLTHAVKADAVVEQVEFKRRPDGSVYWKRANPNGEKTYYFAYQGFAYPYNPGYTYRLSRGELRPSDKLRRYRIVD